MTFHGTSAMKCHISKSFLKICPISRRRTEQRLCVFQLNFPDVTNKINNQYKLPGPGENVQNEKANYILLSFFKSEIEEKVRKYCDGYV